MATIGKSQNTHIISELLKKGGINTQTDSHKEILNITIINILKNYSRKQMILCINLII